MSSADSFAILVKLPAEDTQDCASFHEPDCQALLPRVAAASPMTLDQSSQSEEA